MAGLLSNDSAGVVLGNCNLSVDGAVQYLTIPSDGAITTSEERAVKASHPFSLYASCATGGPVTFTAVRLDLSATAIGSLHDNGTAQLLP